MCAKKKTFYLPRDTRSYETLHHGLSLFFCIRTFETAAAISKLENHDTRNWSYWATCLRTSQREGHDINPQIYSLSGGISVFLFIPFSTEWKKYVAFYFSAMIRKQLLEVYFRDASQLHDPVLAQLRAPIWQILRTESWLRRRDEKCPTPRVGKWLRFWTRTMLATQFQTLYTWANLLLFGSVWSICARICATKRRFICSCVQGLRGRLHELNTDPFSALILKNLFHTAQNLSWKRGPFHLHVNAPLVLKTSAFQARDE